MKESKKTKKGESKVDPDLVVNLFVKIKNKENYFDITSAKPNMKEFVALKLKLLRWTALKLSQDKNVEVFTRLTIPQNPYHPEPYERWTLKGLCDLERGGKSWLERNSGILLLVIIFMKSCWMYSKKLERS